MNNQDVALVADLAKILRQADQPVPEFMKGGGTATYKGDKYGGSDIRVSVLFYFLLQVRDIYKL